MATPDPRTLKIAINRFEDGAGAVTNVDASHAEAINEALERAAESAAHSCATCRHMHQNSAYISCGQGLTFDLRVRGADVARGAHVYPTFYCSLWTTKP